MAVLVQYDIFTKIVWIKIGSQEIKKKQKKIKNKGTTTSLIPLSDLSLIKLVINKMIKETFFFSTYTEIISLFLARRFSNCLRATMCLRLLHVSTIEDRGWWLHFLQAIQKWNIISQALRSVGSRDDSRGQLQASGTTDIEFTVTMVTCLRL